MRVGRAAHILTSRIALRQPPQNFLQAAGESQRTQDQRENQFRVQPMIQKISQHAAQQHRALGSVYSQLELEEADDHDHDRNQ